MNQENTIVIEFENGDDNFEYCREFFQSADIAIEKIKQDEETVSYGVDGGDLTDYLVGLSEFWDKLKQELPDEEKKKKKDLQELKRALGD